MTTTTAGFDTYCAWCTSPWTEHDGGGPGEPGGPSTCPLRAGNTTTEQWIYCGKAGKEVTACPEDTTGCPAC